LTQAEGVSKIYETLFEGRLNYLFELEKMGAKFEMLNPHQAIIIGPRKLNAASISSWDIRAGAAVVIAALVGKGVSEVTNIGYIDRGYEKFEYKLRKLGADIERK
jgi:UDP-N-acetylglucosamine 1-carboxyvinyltransferase